MSAPHTSPYGWLSDEEDILPIGPLLRHWGQPHVTTGRRCFCAPLDVDGGTRHRRMPWESAPGVHKAPEGARRG